MPADILRMHNESTSVQSYYSHCKCTILNLGYLLILVMLLIEVVLLIVSDDGCDVTDNASCEDAGGDADDEDDFGGDSSCDGGNGKIELKSETY
ncbi:Hypothetical predicted protein [Octopus vulgaris]|uniref:Uncharacterized protein n=1 Tax=Octopus vulgaris TaxID=6645 RepID=A0AA36FI12_OCTVU|nr:Hypothetical predicted protein [Octopus vulgaris]